MELTNKQLIELKEKIKKEAYVFCPICNRQCIITKTCSKRYFTLEGKNIPKEDRAEALVKLKLKFLEK